MALDEIVRMLLARYGRADVRGIPLGSLLRDVGVDAVAVAQIVIYLEARFSITIEAGEAGGWTTGDDIFATAQHLLEERHRAQTETPQAGKAVARASAGT
jgi:acyl carrier protein